MNVRAKQSKVKSYGKTALEKRWKEDKKARVLAKKQRMMYCNQYKDQLDEEMKKLFEPTTYNKMNQRQDDSVNIFRWSIDERANIYSKPIERKFVTTQITEEGPVNVHTAHIEEMPEVDMALDKATKWAEAMGECLIRPTWQGGRLQLLLYPRDCFYAECDPQDPLKLILVVIEHTNSEGNTTHYEVWTQDDYAIYNTGWNKIDTTKEARYSHLPEENIFGFVPFFVMHFEYPAAEFWHPYASQDLYSACLDLAVALTDYNHIKHYQSYLLLFIKKDGNSDSKAGVIKSDAGAFIEGSGPNADAKVLNMQANLLNHLEVILKKAQFTLGLRGLRPTIMHGDTQVESGFALMVREHKKLEYHSKLRQLRTIDEQYMWRLCREIIPIEGGPEIPEGQLMIDWPEIGPGGNPIELAQYVQTLQGILSPQQMLREIGKNENEVQKILAELDARPVEGAVNTPGVPTGTNHGQNGPGGEM